MGADTRDSLRGPRYPDAQIIGCVSAAAISNNDKENCSCRGGILGTKAIGIVRDCLYTGTTVTGKDNLGGVLGEKMEKEASSWATTTPLTVLAGWAAMATVPAPTAKARCMPLPPPPSRRPSVHRLLSIPANRAYYLK